MRISVITVCFNSAATIVDTLRSVASQDYCDVEHIVVDGGSTDGTVEMLRQHGQHVAQWISEPDKGLYDAMNKGIALATGEVVGFLNSDDVFDSEHVLEWIAQAMHPDDVDAVYGDVVFVKPDNLEHVVRWWRSTPYKRGAVARGWAPAHPTFYVKRHALVRYGGFDSSLRIASDFELSLRLLDIGGLNAVQVPRVLVRMRTGGRSTRNISAIFEGNREAIMACRRHGIQAGVGFIASKLLRKLPQLFRQPF